jgi:type IV secretory pathway TrbD component
MPGRYRVDWGHLAFVGLIAAAVVWYLSDAMSVSMSVNNLLFIGPVGVFAVLLCCAIVPQCFHRVGQVAPQQRRAKDITGMQELTVNSRKEALQIGLLAASLGALVFLLDVIGFDISLWLFAIAVMLLCGERRPLMLAVFPLAIAVFVVVGFRAMLPYPMYTLVL